MTFVSLKFILFIAAVALIYFLVPNKGRWFVLLAGSYVFYFINSKWLVLVLFAGTLVAFLDAKALDRIEKNALAHITEAGLTGSAKKEYHEKIKKQKKGVLTIGIILDLGTLIFLKYYNFLAESVNTAAGAGRGLPILRLLLPLGISFYTLQAIAYMIDVYRSKYEADVSLPRFMLFMSFFPQIVQGPIARHNHLAHQLYEGHTFDYDRMCKGMQLILWGFFKKLVIADRAGIPADMIFGNYSNYSGLTVFLGVALYGLQVYADFSGGMDIARGVAQILGIDLAINFSQPYFSTSIEDFWRRWHMTLGSWMRDYVFYPLSLSKAFTAIGKKSRKIFGQYVGKRIPAFLSMFIVYLLVGFWHGANWKYVAFGIWNGAFIMVSILLTDVYVKLRHGLHIRDNAFLWRAFQILRTFIIMSLGRFFSRAESISVALHMLRSLTVRWYDLSFITNGSLLQLGLDNANVLLLIASIFVLFVVGLLHEKGYAIRESISRQHIVFRWALFYAAIFSVLIFGIWGPGYNSAAFIYEQF